MHSALARQTNKTKLMTGKVYRSNFLREAFLAVPGPGVRYPCGACACGYLPSRGRAGAGPGWAGLWAGLWAGEVNRMQAPVIPRRRVQSLRFAVSNTQLTPASSITREIPIL